MLNGNSTFDSSSSILAKSFLVASGISRVISDQITGPDRNSALVKKYSNKVRSYASSIPSWKPFADGLGVEIKSNGSVSVSFSGSPNDQQIIDLLEYGTPGTPPESVIRVMAAEIQQDYFIDSYGSSE
jgi:hypothetical protein